ncbi:hypothetical protein PF010_g16220 [Phytophthora fragariae]|uniref:Uncharacterized protein n=1 Tax=Phytophthora fragariae TaxID=53985 RepID=A0A6G0KSK8_9STRA|nr:hypothetical protein PF010_g16220 [Phytophthora fragariae]
MTSTDMHWVLTHKLGLKVQSMMHPVTELTGIKAQQWQVRIKANSCPEEIRHKSLVVVDSAEIVLHHLNTTVNWPCRRCQSPERPTKYCRVSEAELETEAAKYNIQRNGKLPSTLGQSSRVYAAGNHPKTMADLKALLRKEGDNQRTKAPSKKMTVGCLSKRDNATKSNSTADMSGKLSLPPEWGQSVNSASGAPKEDNKASHDAPATSIGKYMVSTEETKQKILEQHAKVVTGGTPTQCVDAKTAGIAEEKEATRAKQVQPDTTNVSKNTHFVEEEQPEVNQPEGSPGWGLHELYEEHKTESDSPSEWMADVEMETVGCEGQRNSEYAEGADFKKSSQDAAQRMSTGGRKGSLSPKRKAAAHWTADRNHDMLEELIGTAQIPRQHRTARSLSPKRRTTEATRRGEKMTMQKFIYQYMTDITGTVETKQADCNAKEQEARPTIPEGQDQQVRGSMPDRTDREANEERSNIDQEDQDCQVTHVSPPTDRGAPLDDWLGILGGTVVDVAANGQSGWIAFYAALYNIEEGLVEVTKAVADSANLLKKRVINSMIANIVDEIKSHPHELQSELRASGCHAEVNGGLDEQMCALVNHLVAQRDKPVKAKAPLHFWVRPAHIRAMAQFAREALYVLDVQEDDQARVQAYAYHDIRDAQDKDIEVGTVCPVPTEQAMALLRDLTAAGITPPVMVLRWRGGGNHFQAVHYPSASHDHYAENIAKLAEARNEILMEHG